MNKQIDDLINELHGVKALLATSNWKRADELLTVVNSQLNGQDGIRQKVWLNFHRSGEVK